MFQRYGVSNALLIPKSKEKILKLKQENMIEDLFRGNRLENKVTPLFKESEYKNVITLYSWKCNSCNTNFQDHLDDGRIPRCPLCYPYTTDSQYEYEIIDFIKSIYNGNIIHGDRKILGRKEIDIFIPQLNIGIEFDGLYYHSEICGGKNRKYHLNKTKQCQELGIFLIHIFEDEWRSKKSIVESRLISILGKISQKKYARQCNIKEVSSNECNIFLNNNHLQGADNSSIRLGLYHQNNLISIMTFGNLRKAMGSNAKHNYWELYRFCSLKNNTVTGGASKLFKYFISKYNPLKVISYSDKRWSKGNLYQKLGFIHIHDSRPNYFYTKDHYKRYYRFGFRKSELSKKLSNFDPVLSEWENMKNNGWDRIWDCGCSKYEWKSSSINHYGNRS
jgi:hypothetical protein